MGPVPLRGHNSFIRGNGGGKLIVFCRFVFLVKEQEDEKTDETEKTEKTEKTDETEEKEDKEKSTETTDKKPTEGLY